MSNQGMKGSYGDDFKLQPLAVGWYTVMFSEFLFERVFISRPQIFAMQRIKVRKMQECSILGGSNDEAVGWQQLQSTSSRQVLSIS